MQKYLKSHFKPPITNKCDWQKYIEEEKEDKYLSSNQKNLHNKDNLENPYFFFHFMEWSSGHLFQLQKYFLSLKLSMVQTFNFPTQPIYSRIEKTHQCFNAQVLNLFIIRVQLFLSKPLLYPSNKSKAIHPSCGLFSNNSITACWLPL